MADSTVLIACVYCDRRLNKRKAEIDRQRRAGRTAFFCSLSCAAHYRNKARKSKAIRRTCPACGAMFATTTKKRAARFCSRGCASRGSVTAHRRVQAQRSGRANRENLISPQMVLKRREAWKYVKLGAALAGRPHEFEFCFPDDEAATFVYDLALLEEKIVVEFDGPYHEVSAQREEDRLKDVFAQEHGWQVIRRLTPQNVVIEVEVIRDLVPGSVGL